MTDAELGERKRNMKNRTLSVGERKKEKEKNTEPKGAIIYFNLKSVFSGSATWQATFFQYCFICLVVLD